MGVDLFLFERYSQHPGACNAGRGDACNELLDAEHLFSNLLDKLPKFDARGKRVMSNLSSSTGGPAPSPGSVVPPVVLMNFPYLLTGVADDDCMRFAGVNCGKCSAAYLQQMRDRLHFDYAAGHEVQLRAAAAYYGWASLSLRDALLAGMRDGAHTRLGWSECEYVTSIIADWVHLTPAGERLFGDVLLQMLLSAQDAEGTRGAEAAADAAAPLRRPPAPLVPGAWKRDLRTCYDTRLDEGQLAVTSKKGWKYVAYETIRGNKVHKPGFVAESAGAEIELKVRTRFELLPLGEPVELSVRFLTSYEHMGSATLTCVRGCTCGEMTLEGHSLERVSVERAVKTSASQAAECTLRLRVRGETQSGENKFKLLGVTINAKI